MPDAEHSCFLCYIDKLRIDSLIDFQSGEDGLHIPSIWRHDCRSRAWECRTLFLHRCLGRRLRGLMADQRRVALQLAGRFGSQCPFAARSGLCCEGWC